MPIDRTPDSRAHTQGLLKVEDVAALLNVSRWFVYDHGEELGLVKIGGANRYLRERVEQYIASSAAKLEPPKPAALQQRPLRRPGSRRVPLFETGR
jgi:predicted DNA-binding transcriptional regulator AlpA